MRVINKSSKNLPINFEKEVRELLKVIPSEHLVGLDSIILVDYISTKKDKDARGAYKKKQGIEKAKIEISTRDLCRFKPYVLRILPPFRKMLIGQVLFHEIGHHYRYITHGISSKQKEDFADQYQKKMLRKTFAKWVWFLTPIFRIKRKLLDVIKIRKSDGRE